MMNIVKLLAIKKIVMDLVLVIGLMVQNVESFVRFMVKIKLLATLLGGIRCFVAYVM